MKRTGLNQLTDIMENRADRPEKNVYFLRINAYSIQVEQLLRQVVERVRKLGVLIDGKLVAPDVRQITYYQEMIGDEFDLNISFIERAISKWLPRLTIDIVKILSNAIYTMLFDLKQIGKNINILNNINVDDYNSIYDLINDLNEIKNNNDLVMVKAKYLGKNGIVTEITKNMRDLSQEERIIVSVNILIINN